MATLPNSRLGRGYPVLAQIECAVNYRDLASPCPYLSSSAVLAEPSGQLAGPADRAQPTLGLFPHGGGGHDEQSVTGPQAGGEGGYEGLLVADDQGDVGLGGQPQLEDLHSVQP